MNSSNLDFVIPAHELGTLNGLLIGFNTGCQEERDISSLWILPLVDVVHVEFCEPGTLESCPHSFYAYSIMVRNNVLELRLRVC